jgi:chemotaxis protein CheX
MIQTSSTFDMPETIRHIVPNVFDTMLSLVAKSTVIGAVPHGERVSGTIGIASDTLSGSVYLHFAEPLARRAAAAMLGLDSPDAADVSAVNDVVSELANMIGGGFKSALCDAGYPCAMSTPAIVRGHGFAIELPPGLSSETFVFDCHGESLAVEVHLKLN